MKKLLAMLLCVVLGAATLTGCGDKKTQSDDSTTVSQDVGTETTEGNQEETNVPELDMSQTVKIGILLSDATTAESLAFQNYYKEYIAKNFNVELIYSDEVADAAEEKDAIDNFIANNCKAVISFSSFDRPAQIDQCAGAGVYYAVANPIR